MVLFTSEFERYLKEKLGKKANFHENVQSLVGRA